MRRRFLFLLPLLALVATVPTRARALEAHDAPSLINELVSQALATIADQHLSDADREAKFRALLEGGFDIPRISRFVLGRYWNAASDQERTQFTQLFENWIVRTYASRFKSYSGQTVQVTGSHPESDTTTVVASQFNNTNGAPPAKVEWHVRKAGDDDYKIVDVAVEGVSMALTQRDEIASVADRNGGDVAGVNKALEERLASAAPPAQ